MNVQTKLTTSLLFVSLITTGTVGGVAYWILLQGFQESIMEKSFENFHEDMTDYLNTYGGWENAKSQQGFHDFVKQKRPKPFHNPDRLGETPPPKMIINRGSEAPFRFLLLDPSGKVLVRAGSYKAGEQASEETIEDARPVMYKNKVALLASPIGTPRLTPQDQSYLVAMRNALFTGAATAFILAISLGFLVGRRASASLRELIQAIHSMKENRELEFPVTVRSQDEIGELANAYNAMNRELAEAHRELRETSECIQQQAEQLKELSIRDPLTGLFNRRHFEEHSNMLFEQAVRYKHPLTVMIGDIDHFKRVNDDFSHAIGDEVLRLVSELLTRGLRKSDLVARYGGEEFVIVFPETDLDRGSDICEAMRKAIETFPWHTVHPELSITMSMGLCDNLFLGSFEKMIAHADECLYVAKRNGRNQVTTSTQTAV